MTGFVAEPPSSSKGLMRFGFDSTEGMVLVEAPADSSGVTQGAGLRIRGEVASAPDWQRADLERRGISQVVRARDLSEIDARRGGVTGTIDRLRDRALAALEASIPQRESSLAKGFVLGDDSEIDERTVEDFRRSGLAHLLAVSGQNIVLLSLLAIPFLALLGVAPRMRLAVIAGLILIYMPLAGGGPSIQRAGVMGLAGLVAAAATRAPSRVYAISLAAMVTLLLDPRATGDIGWQLSFAAVIGIMLAAGPLQARLAGLIGEDGWRRSLVEGTAVTLSATLATGPLMAFHFGQLPVATVLANLVSMPAVAPAMWLGMISIAVGQISPVLAIPFNLANSLFLGWIAQVAEWFGRPGWAVVEVDIHSPAKLIGTSVALLGLVWGLFRVWPVSGGRGRRTGLALAGAICLLLLIPVSGLVGDDRRDLAPPSRGGARVEILDIGQGDAVLIRPYGVDPILVDGGPPGGDLTGALDSAGAERLSTVLLTHPDLDHFGGLLELFGRIPVDLLLFDRAPPELVSAARGSGTRLRRVAEGVGFRAGDVGIEVLWPPDLFSGQAEVPDSNARSIVALMRWHGFRMLLTGDAEAELVPVSPGPIDVLKVAHHGSEDSGLPALLEETRPRLAVISVGEENPYGHPVPEVLDTLARNRIPSLRTDEEGTVSLVLDPGSGLRIETGR